MNYQYYNRFAIQWALVSIYVALNLGFIVPWFISANSTLLVILGLVFLLAMIFVIPLILSDKFANMIETFLEKF